MNIDSDQATISDFLREMFALIFTMCKNVKILINLVHKVYTRIKNAATFFTVSGDTYLSLASDK